MRFAVKADATIRDLIAAGEGLVTLIVVVVNPSASTISVVSPVGGERCFESLLREIKLLT